jgi:hypothetical protein
LNTPELVERIWRQVAPSTFLSRREFIDSLDGWDVTPRQVDGEIVGATMARGADFHFISFGSGRGFSPALISACLQPIIDQHGFVRTRTPKEDLRQQRFNIRIGFKRESEDEFYTYFRMERLRLHGEKTCLS